MENDKMESDQNYLLRLIDKRAEIFKKRGLKFIEQDYDVKVGVDLFTLGFAAFINKGKKDEVQKFIDQIPQMKDEFDILQNDYGSNLCSGILAFITDNDKKTRTLQAFFDAGMDYSFLKFNDGKFFLYSHESYLNEESPSKQTKYRDNEEIYNLYYPFLKAMLFSKNHDKFTEAVQDSHSGQLELRNDWLPHNLLTPYIVGVAVDVASEYLRDYPVVGKKILKPFYDNLTDPQSVLGKYCSNIQYLATDNSEQLEKIKKIPVEDRTINYHNLLLGRKDLAQVYETIPKRMSIFKEEFQKFPSLKNLTEDTINGVLKDKKSIEELPIHTKTKRDLEKGYQDTIHPEKREAYNQDYSKSDKFAKFTAPQNSLSKGAQAANNKTESKQDQTANTSSVRMKRL